MSQTMTLTVHATNLLTANQRAHWAVRARLTRTLRHAAAISARAQGIEPMRRAHLTVHVSWPDRRRRDVHNVMPTIKAIVDGLVQDAGVLPDDDDTHLTGPDLRVTAEMSGLRGVTRFVLVLDDPLRVAETAPGAPNATARVSVGGSQIPGRQTAVHEIGDEQ